MAKEVKLPQLGQTMEEGTIVSCLVKVGDQVKKGDVLFEIETDKATLELESPDAGFVKQIVAQQGQTLPVGDTVLILGAKDEKVTSPAATMAAAKQAPAPKLQPAAAKAEPEPAPAAAPAGPVSAEGLNAVRLPQLGQTMEEGTIVNCLVKVGDKVKKGDVLFEIETDKATLELESPAAGFVKHVIAQSGQTLPVGDPVLVLGTKDAQVSDAYLKSLAGAAPAAAPADKTPAPAASAPAAPPAPAPPGPAGRIIASPRAKLAAKQLGVDLAAVTGTGPNGRIIEADVKKASASPKPAPVAQIPAAAKGPQLGQTIKATRLQQITAKRMLQSKAEIPCFYLNVKVDVTDLVGYRTELKESGTNIAYNDFIIKAVGLGLEKYPIMTGQIDGDNIKLAPSIGIGLAIAVPDGLVAPIVKDVQAKTVDEVHEYSQGLIDRARAGKLAPDDMYGGCITVSNLGAFGIDSFIPICVPGQASILGIGRIADVLVPLDGSIILRKMMNMTLSVDHKVTNGAYAAQFLDHVRKLLEDPSNFK
jgi:pyruvate dehydrogenase E2 component (dihydrolipoamide acetyltransferase)